MPTLSWPRPVHVALAVAGLALATPSLAQDAPGAEVAKRVSREQTIDALKVFEKSCVVVEVRAKNDRGQSPPSPYGSWSRSRSSDAWEAYPAWSSLISMEIPYEAAGYVLAPDLVLVRDFALDDRFIESINVRSGDKLINATPERYFLDRNAMVLKLAEPLKDRTPLEFKPDRPKPHIGVSYMRHDGQWMVTGGSGSGDYSYLTLEPSGKAINRAPNTAGFMIDSSGAAVGGIFADRTPADDSWRGSPMTWPALSAADHDAAEKAVAAALDSSILRTSLRLRSPRTDPAASPYGFDFGPQRGQHNAGMTEWHGTSVLLDPTTLLVLANLDRKDTARLETIKVFTPAGQSADATFVGTLRDYGGFIAKLSGPLSGSVPASDAAEPLQSMLGKLLINADVSVVGETRVAYFIRDRINSLQPGWRRQLVPDVAAVEQSYSWRDDGTMPVIHFLFDPKGKLVAIPLQRRTSVADRGTDDPMARWSQREFNVLPIAYAREAVKAGKDAFDADNKPLSEENENRLAWLGVELQAMNEDLARAANLVTETRGGRFGATVTYLYPGSPAAKIGVQPGDTLLRIVAKGQPKPIDIQIMDYGMEGFDFTSLFEHMDEMPPEYMDRLPAPWGSAENVLTRTLTDLGVGTPVTVEAVRDGKPVSFTFNVEMGPEHYEGAKRFKSEAAGLTVRSLTYEVRRFLQLTPDDPGVIVSKLERGERGAIAGIKPFEVITAVNDKPVRNVDEFQAAIAPGGEFKLAVKRMAEGRIVKFKIEPEKPKDASK